MTRTLGEQSAPFEDGRLRVCERKCRECVYLPRERATHRPGDLERLEEASIEVGLAVLCVATTETGGPTAVCHHFFMHKKTRATQAAFDRDRIAWIAPPITRRRLLPIPHRRSLRLTRARKAVYIVKRPAKSRIPR